jgi:hypothetical protein
VTLNAAIRATLLRPRVVRIAVALVAWAALAFGLVFNIVTLTRAPEPYGDEAWAGSAVWSLTHGHGLQPAIAAGSGIYGGTFDHWIPRIGIAPQLVAELVVGTDFTAYRAASLVVSMIALAVLWIGMRRRYGHAVGSLAAAAVSTTWVFVAASHYIRWDGVTLLWTSTIFTLLVWGPPTWRRALAIGALIGVAPDFSVPTFALVPAAALLVLWVPGERRSRALAFAGGILGGLVVYALLHFVPDPHEARVQYRLIYGQAYRVPLFDALQRVSLTPILDEGDRYRAMGVSPLTATRLFLLTAVASAFAALGAVLLRRRGDYPWPAVGSLLLISQLAGLALLYANRAPVYVVGALPFAAAALVEGFSALPRLRRIAPVAILAIITVIGGRTVIDGVRASEKGAATDARASRIARSFVRPGEVVVGDYVYWWLFRDARFRFNAVIWADEYQHHVSFEQAFHDTCPAVVLYDEFWQNRYPAGTPGSLGFIFPALAPTDPTEGPKLLRLLVREYRFPPRVIVAGGRTITLWRRKVPRCT